MPVDLCDTPIDQMIGLESIKPFRWASTEHYLKHFSNARKKEQSMKFSCKIAQLCAIVYSFFYRALPQRPHPQSGLTADPVLADLVQANAIAMSTRPSCALADGSWSVALAI